MPAPANDAYTAAITIGGAPLIGSGSIAGTNVEATPDAGLSEAADVKSVWYRGYLVTRHEIFLSLRSYAADGADQTNFDAVLTLYGGSTGVPTGIFASSDDYAGWEHEPHIALVYGITTTNYYFIRIHGKAGAEGKFVLRWGPAPKRILTRKSHVRKNDGYLYVAGARLPNITGASSTNFTHAVYGNTHPAGLYFVRYAGGTFQFGNTAVPNPGDLVDWVATRKAGYQFLKIGHVFPVSATQTELRGPNDLGNASSIAALNAALFIQDSVLGPTYRSGCWFNHVGGPITLDFADDQYTDNLAGDPLPGFVLYRVVPVFELVLPPAFGTVTIDGDSGVVFTLRNPGHVAFINVKVVLELVGLTVPINPVPTDVTFNTYGGLVSALNPFAYTFNLADQGITNFTARLKIYDEWDLLTQTFDTDLTPVLKIRAPITVAAAGSPTTWLATFPIYNAGHGPTRDLSITLAAVGMAAPTPTVVDDVVIQPHTTHDLEVTFTAPAGQAFEATFSLVDGPYTHPAIVATGTAEAT